LRAALVAGPRRHIEIVTRQPEPQPAAGHHHEALPEAVVHQLAEADAPDRRAARAPRRA
jgi:hypothetical protein